MTLIGVPLLGMVVYNYRLVEMSNSIKRSEYENEMAMDIISRIIRETVIDAITKAKDEATEGVNELAELQRTNFSSTQGKYTSLWINEYNTWANGIAPDAEVLGGFLNRLEIEAGSADGITIRNWWMAAGTPRESIKQEEMNKYVAINVEKELDNIESDSLSDEEDLAIGVLLNNEGIIDADSLNEAYNTIFRGKYQSYIEEKIKGKTGVPSKILVKNEYKGIIDEDKIDVTGLPMGELLEDESSIVYSENYLKIDTPVVRVSAESIEVDALTRFKKNKVTPSTTLSATFIIKTPGFDSVASVTQETITLSNALLNQGGVIVGGKLVLDDNTVMQIANDLTVLGEGSDTAVLLSPGAQLVAKKPSGEVSNSRISVAKDIVLDGEAILSTGYNPTYYRNLYVGDSDSVGTIDIDFMGDVVAEDDLEINHEGTVDIDQVSGTNYYGFNDTNNKGPDSSSSIVINSKTLTNKYISLGNLYLAGRAFIEGVLGTKNEPMVDSEGNILRDDAGNIKYADTTYKTGESIAIKGNYIAYQTPLFDNSNPNYMFSPAKLNFSTYFMKRGDSEEKQYAHISLADNFIIEPSDFKGTFDVNYKWKYFKDYAEKYASILKSVGVISNIRYIEGTAFDNTGKVVGSSNETITDTSFRNNLATEYEKYTKYFGYRPVDATGVVDTTKAKTKIFGSNGWIKNFSDSDKSSNIEGGKYYQIYTNGNKTVNLSGSINKGVIVCKGNLTLNVPSDAIFSGVIIVGGDLTINGGKLIFEDAKEEVINTVIGNYLGTNSDITGGSNILYETFTYDGSGSSYIVTDIGDEIININELIGITNWKKSSYGRL